MQRLGGNLLRTIPLVLAFAATAPAASADVVRMKSGDVVSGKIEKVSDEELTVDPPFSDAIEIKLEYIASIVTERPVKVTFKDGHELTGYIELAADGTMQVRAAPSRWETKHSDTPRLLGKAQAPSPAPGSTTPLAEIAAVKELEIAYYRYDAEIGLGFNAASGNTKSSAFDFSASLEPSWGPNSIRLDGALNRRESSGALSAKNWSVNLQYERDLPKSWYALLLSANESDPFQSLELRSSLALAGGYRFFDVDPTHLSVALGAGYIRENFTPPSPDREFPAALWKLDFERDLFRSDLTLYHKHTLIRSFTGSELIVKTTQGIEIDLFDDLDLKIEFGFDHASDPAAGVLEKNDLRYIVKLDYSFEGDETDWLH